MAVLAMRFHMRQEDLQPVDQSFEVDADHPIPVGRRDLFDPAGAGDAGVVAEDVHLAEFGKSLCGGVGEGVSVGYVAGHAERRHALAAEHLNGVGASRRLDVGDRHVHAALTESAA